MSGSSLYGLSQIPEASDSAWISLLGCTLLLQSHVTEIHYHKRSTLDFTFNLNGLFQIPFCIDVLKLHVRPSHIMFTLHSFSSSILDNKNKEHQQWESRAER